MNLEEAAHHATVFDDDTQHVARVYAAAFLNAADKLGQAAEMVGDLDALVTQVFPRERYLEAFFSSRAIGRDRKAELLRTVFKGRVSDLFLHFLLVLNEHDRLDAIRAVAAACKEMYGERTGKMRVEVSSAQPLADDQQEKLRRELQAKFGREPVLDTRVDPELLGGLTIRVGDVVYDGSVRTRLERIRTQLIERSSHAIQGARGQGSGVRGEGPEKSEGK